MASKTGRAALLLVLVCLLPGAGLQVARAAPSAVWRIFILDVGQGDATLIRDGLGTDVLVDGGRKSTGETVLASLRQLQVDDLEAILATHADSDHVGGLIDVLLADDIPVESALYNGYPGDTQTWGQFVAAVAAEGLSLLPAQYPGSFTWGTISASVLNPPPGLPDPEPQVTDFAEAVRKRRRFALNERNCHRSCTLVNLAKIAVQLGRPLRFDPERQRFINDEEADRLADQPMRAPWHL